MNNTNNLPCAYRFEMYTHSIPEFPLEAGLQNVYFNRFRHDTTVQFTMKYNLPRRASRGCGTRGSCSHDRARRRRGPAGLRPLRLRPPANAKFLDLLDSSFRNDTRRSTTSSATPTKNTEEVRCAAYYNGTYYLEVNELEQHGLLRRAWEKWAPTLSTTTTCPTSPRRPGPGLREPHPPGVRPLRLVQVEANTSSASSSTRSSRRTCSTRRFTGSTPSTTSTCSSRAGSTRFTTTPPATTSCTTSLTCPSTSRPSDWARASTTSASTRPSAPRWRPTRSRRTGSSSTRTRTTRRPTTSCGYGSTTRRRSTARRQVIKPIEDLVVDEDTEQARLPQALRLLPRHRRGRLRAQFKVSLVTGKLKRLILEDDMVGFQAWPDYSGKVVVKVRARTASTWRPSLTWNITFMGVNDPPYAKGWNPAEGPYSYYMPETPYGSSTSRPSSTTSTSGTRSR